MIKINRALAVCVFSVFILFGCAIVTEPNTVQPEKVVDKTEQPVIREAVQIKDSVKEEKVDYKSWGIFILYIISLATVCLYFKHTGKRMRDVELSMTTMVPKLNPLARALSCLAKVIGLIYCKKK